MSLFKTIIKKISVVCVISLLAVGCGGDPQKKREATLIVWAPFAMAENLKPVTQAFEKANKGVRVQVVDKEVTDYQREIVEALAASKGPDIFAINNTWLPEYLDKITPAQENIWKFVDFKRDFVDVVTDDFTKSNTIYGTAFSVDTLGLYYNKAILADAGVYTPPATWSELQFAVQNITRRNELGLFTRSGISMGHSSYSIAGKINRAEDILYLLALQQGGSSFKADGSAPLFGNTIIRNGKSVLPTVEALKFYTSFADPNSPNYTWNALSDYSIDAFANGKSAMMINYSYAKNVVKQKNPNLKYDIAPVPQFNLETPAINFANYWGQVVSKQSPNADLAWEFLKFATQKEQLDIYLNASNEPASRKDLLEVQQNNADLSVFAHSTASAKSYFRPFAQEMDKIFGASIDSVIFKNTDPKNAVAQAVRQAQAVIQRRN